MGLMEIISLPAPVLRRKARKVEIFDDELLALVDDMIETMRAAPGVGLAAPQVSDSRRLIVVEYGDDENEEAPKKLFVVANPELKPLTEEKVMGVEGCLSVPGLVGEVARYSKVQVKGQNKRGQPVKITAEGWLARIFQHEVDHLNGVLFPDIAEEVWQPSEEEEKILKD